MPRCKNQTLDKASQENRAWRPHGAHAVPRRKAEPALHNGERPAGGNLRFRRERGAKTESDDAQIPKNGRILVVNVSFLHTIGWKETLLCPILFWDRQPLLL